MEDLRLYFEPLGFKVQYLPINEKPGEFAYLIEHADFGIRTAINYIEEVEDDEFWELNRVKLLSVLSNGKNLDINERYDRKSIQSFIDTYYVNLSPEDKLNTVIEYVGDKSRYDGQISDFKMPSSVEAIKRYFKNNAEWKFYVDTAIAEGYIVYSGMKSPFGYGLTITGLTRLIKFKEGKDSRFCFVAMAFVPEMILAYKEAIEPAIRSAQFEPYIVNQIDVESDKTINDAILAGIKKAKFTIADFTFHRSGVYFEAGFALGRSQKVIYTCREDEMEKAHFDIRNYQHIVWSDAADLKEKLINKIEAFILE